jgi:hypothetical protein
VGQPQDIAAAASFFVRDEASFAAQGPELLQGGCFGGRRCRRGGTGRRLGGGLGRDRLRAGGRDLPRAGPRVPPGLNAR